MKKFIVSLIFVFGLLFSGTVNASTSISIPTHNRVESVVSDPEPEFIPIVVCWVKTTTIIHPDGTIEKHSTVACAVIIV